MLAGGTGLAPFLSMLGKVAETGCDQPIHLVYGVTNDSDLVEVETIAEYAKRIPNFHFATVVADKGSNHPLKGYVTHHLEAKHLNAGDVDVYLCGPPPMVEAVRVFFRDQGVNPVNFPYEKVHAHPGGSALPAPRYPRGVLRGVSRARSWLSPVRP